MNLTENCFFNVKAHKCAEDTQLRSSCSGDEAVSSREKSMLHIGLCFVWPDGWIQTDMMQCSCYRITDF